MKKIGLLLLCSLMNLTANATLMTGEVAEDAFVTVGGYDLAWASPCSDGLLESSCSNIDLTEQSGYGWKVITSSLFSSLGINASTFIVDYSSSNTKFYNGKNYAKAAGWFSNDYSHIDVNDGIAGLWSFADIADSQYWAETIVYRDSSSVNIPEPTPFTLLALGLVTLGISRRKLKA
ncbi:hypothetical protein GCM10009111_18390 [Colwellia asteriadis]|uniref:PEP-CTERM protein-sorting domain-containing protein n=1 Tax=Colwellia asteriadis TaxID=517723 RepID=A0ABN1L6Y8_9GAMM